MAALTIVSKSLNTAANKKSHHTEYFLENFCLRRGQSFAVSITYNRMPQSTDSLKFSAVYKDYQRVKTLQTKDVPISNSTSKTAWSARIVSTAANNTVNYEIYPPANAIIGNYSLNALTAGGNYNVGDFCLLFNSWSPDDSVYLSDPDKRYVYHDVTYARIYTGSFGSVGYRNWDFGQFEPDVLNVSLKMMEFTKDVLKRNNPIILSRDLSAAFNVQDDSGVMVGNWSGEYSDATAPGTWNGSDRIMKQYADTKQPVRYGQCWVFAGLLCSALRCLGIPARVITNFASAHDTNGNATIERYFDAEGEPIPLSGDSIWNFHCWTEGWMSRASDLGTEYDGWQVVDATPQERSGGRYCLGPTAVKAIRKGYVDMPHDTMFAYSEVNADVMYMYQNAEGETYRTQKSTAAVGKLTCTMARDLKSLDNITLEYKPAEGSQEERQVHQHAYSIASSNSGFRSMSAQAAAATVVPPESLIKGTIDLQVKEVHVGENINATLKLQNPTDKSKEVEATINVKSIVYDGIKGNTIKVEKQKLTLEPKTDKTVEIKVSYSEYKKLLMDDNIVHITVICDDKGELAALVEKDINLINPSIEIKVLGPASVEKPLQCEVSFLNPLDGPVNDCVVTVEGSGLAATAIVKKIASIAAKQKGVVQFDLTPTKTGNLMLMVNFNSDKFKDMKGSQAIQVA